MVILNCIAAVMVAATLAGCFGNRDVSCAKPREYQASRSIAPLQVPQGLDTPDPSTELKIPETTQSADASDAPGCLEQPPDYFGR